MLKSLRDALRQTAIPIDAALHVQIVSTREALDSQVRNGTRKNLKIYIGSAEYCIGQSGADAFVAAVATGGSVSTVGAVPAHTSAAASVVDLQVKNNCYFALLLTDASLIVFGLVANRITSSSTKWNRPCTWICSSPKSRFRCRCIITNRCPRRCECVCTR